MSKHTATPDLHRPESFPDAAGVPMDACDREGNLVHSVSSNDDCNGTDLYLTRFWALTRLGLTL